MSKPSWFSSFRQSTTYKILKNGFFFLVIFLALQAWKQRDMADGEAPAFQATLLQGETITLDAYRGKPLLLHFWSSTCPICKLEEGSISDLNRDKNIQVLTVAFYSGSSSAVTAFLKERQLTAWPVVLDQEGELGRKYGVIGVPATFFIDAGGKIRFRTIGLTSKWGMKIRLWLTRLYS